MSFNLSEQGRTHLGHVGDRNQGHDADHTWNREQELGTIPREGATRDLFLPAENGLKWSLYLNFPFSFRKCSGLNFSGSGNSWLSYKRESSVGIMTVPWKEERLPWSQHRLSPGSQQLNFTLDKMVCSQPGKEFTRGQTQSRWGSRPNGNESSHLFREVAPLTYSSRAGCYCCCLFLLLEHSSTPGTV